MSSAEEPRAMFGPGAAPVSDESVRFAVIGSAGTDTRAEKEVAALVHSWDVDFVITTGDNRIGRSYEQAVGRDEYYCDFVEGGSSGCPSHHFRRGLRTQPMQLQPRRNESNSDWSSINWSSSNWSTADSDQSRRALEVLA